MIALYDSGGAWFIEDDGQTKLAAVTSFRANQDAAADSDYGDIWGNSRITRDQDWIDSNNAASYFWTNTNGNWNTASHWDGSTMPIATSTAVVNAGLARVNSSSAAEFLFVDRAGTVEMNSSLQASLVLLKRGGVLDVGAASGGSVNLTGSLQQDAEGVLNIGIHGDTNPGTLAVSGSIDLAGELTVEYQSGYAGPDRGQFQSHVVATADDVNGAFTTIDGQPIVEGVYTYIGENAAGEDGVFRTVSYANNAVTLVDYLAVPGDANGDGFLDTTDFNIWNMYKFTSGTDWLTGDFNGDGVTDTSDFNAWNERKFTSIGLPAPTAPIAPVPEPGTGLLGIIASLLLAASSRRRTN